MTDKTFIYENDKFFVDVEMEATNPLIREGATYTDYYVVVNKEFGIIEFMTPSIVEAISGAAMAQATLEGEPWKFYATKAKSEIADLGVPGSVTLQ
jgi:hypothetical protein